MAEIIDNILSYNVQLQGLLLELVIALLIILAGFIAGKLAGRLVRRALHEAEIDNMLSRAGTKLTLENKLSSITKYSIYTASLIIAIESLSIAAAVVQIMLFGAIVLLILAAFVFLKDFIPNAAAGFFIFKKKLIKKGDTIKIHGASGKVENIGIVETEISTRNNEKVFIPNSNFLKNELKIKKSKK